MSRALHGDAVAVLVGLLVVVALGAAGSLVPSLARPIGRRAGLVAHHRNGAGTVDVVDVAEQVARDVRSGQSLRSAVAHAASTAPAVLGEVSEALGRETPLREALTAQRPRGDERDLLVHAFVLGVDHPEVVAGVLDRTATVVRERRVWRLERRAHAAQARASARVLTLLPLGFAAWGALSSASVRHAYVSSPVTVAIAAFGLSLNVVGWLWMHRVVGGER